MANEHIYEFHNDISGLESKPSFVDGEFTEEHPEPNTSWGEGKPFRYVPSEPAAEVVEAEIVETEAPGPDGRVLFQIHHPASGSFFPVWAPSVQVAICWLFGTADILYESGCELWPVQDEPETPVVPYRCWAAAAYAYCLYKRAHPDH